MMLLVALRALTMQREVLRLRKITDSGPPFPSDASVAFVPCFCAGADGCSPFDGPSTTAVERVGGPGVSLLGVPSVAVASCSVFTIGAVAVEAGV